MPAVSFRTTTGMLVTGSIIKPRILTSSSMVASATQLPTAKQNSDDVLSEQIIRADARDARKNVFTEQSIERRSEIQ